MTHRRTLTSIAIAFVFLAVSVSADSLVLKDGRRVEGQLIAVRDGIVEFEGRVGGFGRLERLRIDRADVRRIELDEIDFARERGREQDRDFGRDRDQGGQRGSSRPSGLRERDLNVDAAVAWNDTSVDVREGQTVYFSARGQVRWGPRRQDGPEGEHNSPYNALRPIPSRPGAALIGRVGDSKDYFFIGDDQGPIRIRTSGRLHLGVNDDFLQDNSGSFRVTVYY